MPLGVWVLSTDHHQRLEVLVLVLGLGLGGGKAGECGPRKYCCRSSTMHSSNDSMGVAFIYHMGCKPSSHPSHQAIYVRKVSPWESQSKLPSHNSQKRKLVDKSTFPAAPPTVQEYARKAPISAA